MTVRLQKDTMRNEDYSTRITSFVQILLKVLMARQLMTVCVLCLLCTTHAQCAGSRSLSSSLDYTSPQELRPLRTRRTSFIYGRRIRRDLPTTDHDRDMQNSHLEPIGPLEDDGEVEVQLRRIFAEFGDPTLMTLNFKEFSRLVQSGRLTSTLSSSQTSKLPANFSESNASSNSNLNSSTLKATTEIPHAVQPGNTALWQCLPPREFLGKFGVENDVVTPTIILQMCPTLLAHIYAPMSQEKLGSCLMVPSFPTSTSKEHLEEESEEVPEGASLQVWLCATGSIVIVSLCGLLGVGVIPFMQRVFYQQLLQFLVALAVGTLCGDALLHLLPHAILGPEGHSHGHSHGHSNTHVHNDEEIQREFEEYSQHTAAVWRGFVACMGLIFFFVTEKCLTLVAEWRKRRQRRAHPAGGHRHKVKVMRDIGGPPRNNSRDGGCTANGNSNSAGNGRGDQGLDVDGTVIARSGKQCKHKYSSYPYCYGEISDAADLPASGEAEGLTAATRLPPENVPCCVEELKLPGAGGDAVEVPDVPADMHPSECESYTVIIREHETTHHGHSHAHGHVHAAPRTMSSVAWMVVMGDGLHNLTDGVAIGAAFAAGLPGGFSTALAVLCHELPHELGDFAVLLKAGMSLKQAVFYNVLSSLLCLLGMLFGVALGHSASATPLVFGAAAGMFLYIALVDMIPELSSNHSQEGGSVCQCVLQVLGMLSGTGVMLLIALYEHDLKSVFNESIENHS